MQSDHAEAIDGAQTIDHNSVGDDVDPEEFISGLESFDIEIDRALLDRFTVRRPDKEEIFFESAEQEQLYDILQDHVGKDNAISSAELSEMVRPSDGSGQPATREDLAKLIEHGAPILASGNGYFMADSVAEVRDYGEGMISRIMGNLKRMEAAFEATLKPRHSTQTPDQEPDDPDFGPSSKEANDKWSAVDQIWGEEWVITIRTAGNEAVGDSVHTVVNQSIGNYLLSDMDTHSFEAGDRPDSAEKVSADHQRNREFVDGESHHMVKLEGPEWLLDAEFETLLGITEDALPDGWERMVEDGNGGEP